VIGGARRKEEGGERRSKGLEEGKGEV